jgi:hypothetical protein
MRLEGKPILPFWQGWDDQRLAMEGRNVSACDDCDFSMANIYIPGSDTLFTSWYRACSSCWLGACALAFTLVR